MAMKDNYVAIYRSKCLIEASFRKEKRFTSLLDRHVLYFIKILENRSRVINMEKSISSL